MALHPTAENFRSEIARWRLRREDICQHIGMNHNTMTMYVNGVRPLADWAAHNIGLGINRATGRRLFNVDESLGVRHYTPGRRSSSGFRAKARRKNRSKRRQTHSGPLFSSDA
jgi:hypothetical protein